MTHRFQIGRAHLLTMDGMDPFPRGLRHVDDDVLSITSGIFHPDTGNTAPELRRSAGAAFVQQWLGLNSEPDAVPLVSTAAPQLSGAYRVRSAAIDWLKYNTNEDGVVEYSAELERLRPTSSAAVSEVQHTTAFRSVATHAVTPRGVLMLPRRFVHQNAGTMQFFREGDDGFGTAGDLAGAGPGVGSYQFATESEHHYAGGCSIELRDSPASPWYKAQGRQIPNTNAADIRMSNGGIRITWDGRQWATAGAGTIHLEQSLGDPGAWSTVGIFTFTESANWRPIGTPSIRRNAVDSVIVKFPCGNLSNSASHYISAEIGRGQTFVKFSALDRILNVVEASNPGATTLTGGRRSTAANSDGFHWIVATPDAFTTPGGTVLSVAGGSGTSPRSWALGVSDAGADVVERRNHDQVVAQYWAGISSTQRFVGL